MALSERIRVQAECRKSARAVAVREDVGAVEQFVQAAQPVGRPRVEQRAALAG